MNQKTNSYSKYQLSVDPSINTTGLCLWCDGKVIDHCTVFIPESQRKTNLVNRVIMLLRGVQEFLGKRKIKKLQSVAIEVFGGQRRNQMLKMMLCSAAQGGLIGCLDRYTSRIIPINKYNESKEFAWNMAINYGLTDFDEHVADAFRLGQLAGFDRNE